MAIRDVLSNDALWNNPLVTYSQWGKLLGYHPKSLQQDALHRGWKRDVRGMLVTAPCARCDIAVGVHDLNDRRVCGVCRENEAQLDAFGNNPVALFRSELARRGRARC